MEIGSFLEMQFPKGREWYAQTDDVARLNSGRAAIWHAVRVLGCKTVWLPYYQCDTVREFLQKHCISIKYYHIDATYTPTDLAPESDEAVVIVNYYGIMSKDRLMQLAAPHTNVIIDNSQGFFAAPLDGCMNVYSARKFVGVPDGAYVVGRGAGAFVDEYPQGYSSDTSLFLLQRIEYGCEGKTYQSRMLNEHRIDAEDCSRMSALTHAILDGTNYEIIRNKRRENFELAHSLFSDVNRLDPLRYYADDCVPMVYPLIVEDDRLLPLLLEHKHFQGHWWSYLLDEMEPSDFEYYVSRYVIPITIDQRYGVEELSYIRSVLP